VASTELPLACTDIHADLSGSSVTVEAGFSNRELYLETLDLLPSQHRWLNHLATGSPDDYARFGATDLTEGEFLALSKLNKPRAQRWLALLAAARASVGVEALAEASSRIKCEYGNAEATATCPAGAVTSENPPEGATGYRNPSVVAAGTFYAATKAEANLLAALEAERLLGCVFGNQEVTVTCPGDDVPTDELPLGGQTDPRVGSVTVAANTVFRASQEEADAAALLQARSELNCYYLSAELLLSCVDVDEDWEGVLVVDDEAAALVLDGQRGNPVRVPAYALRSDVSQEDADARAHAVAMSGLDCRWGNAQQTATCAPVWIATPGFTG
jgi:hypothetical protein